MAILSPAGKPVTWRKVAARHAEIGLPDDGFADDVEAAQAAQPRLEPPAATATWSTAGCAGCEETSL